MSSPTIMELNHEEVVTEEEVQQLIKTLPKTRTNMYGNSPSLINYQGFWYLSIGNDLKNTLTFQRHFRARDSDLIIASHPKTGTTWLKALLFATVNRFKHPKHESPLLKHHPHELVHRLENDIYGNAFEYPRPHHLNELPSPRFFSTHLPYTSLPESITTKPGCRVVYISRNPLDTLVSFYYFVIDAMKMLKGEDVEPPSLENCFKDFYDGTNLSGPFFEHVLGYWKWSLEQSDNKVLFLKFEELKEDPTSHVKKLAEFAGMPFSAQEESEGVIQDIIEMCSIKNLKELEVNKSGVINKLFEKKSYFRKGEVGDGSNHCTPSMVGRMNDLMQQKFEGTGLSL